MTTEDTGAIVGAKAKLQEKRYPLESAPGGWVTVRRLSHGEATARLDTMLVFRSGAQEGSNVRVISNWAARVFDFAHAIVDHNLGDMETGLKFDFKKEADVAALEEDIGDEIQAVINRHHGRVAIQETEDDDAPETDPNS